MSDDFPTDTEEFCFRHAVARKWCDCVFPDVNPPASPPDPLIGFTGGTGGFGGFRSRSFDKINARKTRTLNGLPKGRIVALIGEEGIGKGLYECWLIARLTTAQQPVNVLMIVGEDDPEETLRPRLEAAGADLTRVHLMFQDEDSLTGVPMIPAHSDDIKSEIAAHDIGVVIVDPWISTVSSTAPVKDTQVARAVLHAAQTLAKDTDVALMLVMHPNRTQGSMRDRYGLTGVMRQVARVTFFALESPEDDTLLYVGVEKANGSSRDPALAFRKIPSGDDFGSWMLEVADEEPRLTIREWDARFNDLADGRRTDKWSEIVSTADGQQGLITRQQIIDVYKDATVPEKAADKAIGRFVHQGRLVRSDARGTYEV